MVELGRIELPSTTLSNTFSTSLVLSDIGDAGYSDLPPLSLYAAELRLLPGLFLSVARTYRRALCPHLLGCGKLTLHVAVEGEDCVGFLKGRSELVGVCFYLF